MKKKKSYIRAALCVSLFIAFLACVSRFSGQARAAPEGAPPSLFSARLEIPRCANTDGGHEIHEYKAFALCYRESYELSEWAAYELTREELAVVVSRGNNFRSDPSISTGSALPADYAKTGYDRGHLAPAADMRFDAQAMSESFFMSNMAPQTPELNRRVWKNAEDMTRSLAREYGRAWVVSGPVLERDDYNTIGQSAVSVPDYFYKAILFPIEEAPGYAAAAFIMPNHGPSKNHLDYLVSVDEIEARTGLDLFCALGDEIESIVEARVWQ
jgi:endonuclease G